MRGWQPNVLLSEAISLDDDDTDSLVSASFDCAVCGEVGASFHVPCCSCAAHRGCIDDGVDASCVFYQRDLRDVVDAAAVRCQLCDAAVGMGSDSMSFACCPQSAFHLACLAPIANIVDNQVGCPVCVGERREHVNAVWFERLCLINGVQWPVEAVQTSDIDCTLCCEPMVPDDSIVVPCCEHRLHVSCLSRSLSSCGLRCPYCNQDLSEFAVSSSFQAASVFHECMVDVSVPPSNRGLNSMMLPAGFPAAPPVSFLCCHRRGPPPEFALLSDRRMEWSPVRDPCSGAWAPQWICVQCSRTVDSSILPGCSVNHVLSVASQRRQDFLPQSVTSQESTPGSQMVLSRSSCQLGFSVRVGGLLSSDPTRHKVTVLVVLSVDLIGVACSRAHPWCSSVQHRIQSRCA